jgi:hypothetical protein
LLSGEKPLALSRSPPKDLRGTRWDSGDLAHPAALKFPQIETISCTVEVGLLVEDATSFEPISQTRGCLHITSIVTKVNSELASERESMSGWAEAEQKLIAECERLGIGWTILRPTIICAEGRDRNVTRLARLIQTLGFCVWQAVWFTPTSPRRGEAAINKIYALPGRDAISMDYKSLEESSLFPRSYGARLFVGETILPNANAAMGTRLAKGHNL